MPISRSSLTRVLGRLGLQFAGGADVGNQGQVDVEDVLVAAVGAELADRFEKGERFDVADRAADFDDGNVRILGVGQDLGLDLVGDVRDDLHRAAEVVAAPFFLDDRVVDLAGGEVGAARQIGGGEALVVAEVEIGFGAVVGDEHLAVLEGAHGSRIDVDVGVHFLHGDPQPARFHERADGSCRQPLAEGGNHAAGDEDELGLH